MHSRLDHIDDWAKLAGTANYKVGALARACGVSVRQLFRFFEEKHNRSPHEWLHELRMRRASELLCDRSTAKEVAIKLNYKDAAHFTHDFKGYFGVAPSDYIPSQVEFGFTNCKAKAVKLIGLMYCAADYLDTNLDLLQIA